MGTGINGISPPHALKMMAAEKPHSVLFSSTGKPSTLNTVYSKLSSENSVPETAANTMSTINSPTTAANVELSNSSANGTAGQVGPGTAGVFSTAGNQDSKS